MNTLKTITDEGKREFIDKHVSDTDREIICNTDTLLAFLDTYAEKVATEVYRAILPKKESHINPKTGMNYYKGINIGNVEGWNDCRAFVERAFNQFIGKV